MVRIWGEIRERKIKMRRRRMEEDVIQAQEMERRGKRAGKRFIKRKRRMGRRRKSRTVRERIRRRGERQGGANI